MIENYLYGGLALILFVTILFFSIKGRVYNEFVKSLGKDVPLKFMAPISLYIIDRYQIITRFYGRVSFIQQKMIGLHGNRMATHFTKLYLAQIISTIILCFTGSVCFALFNEGDHTLFFVGLFFTVIIPMMMIRNLTEQERRRKDEIIAELPEYVNKVILLVNAGETIQQAMIRSAFMNKEKQNHPLYKELMEAMNKLQSNHPFHQVLNDLSKRCGIQEVSIFTTTVLLNYRKGGQDLILALRELSGTLWEKRKAISKIKGEEASSKLVFPLILIFISVMIIIGFPALTLF
ncbi:type II secretion system F family protein [Bacillus kwashiorkori]|uniref:type II secretion system F family protein n=1 Tax=Bacillus kwashiorkori TaxID=1522318 RepID=UPI000785F30C|nr:type II secretion system F family protein [Bacillus kwashiorkori]